MAVGIGRLRELRFLPASPPEFFLASAASHARVRFGGSYLYFEKSPQICPLGGGGYFRIRGRWFSSACAARFFIQRERRQSAVWLSPLERAPPTKAESVQVGEQLVAGH